MTRLLAVLSGGLSEPSSTRLLADRLAGAVTREVTARGEGLAVEVVELRPLARDIADHLVSGVPSARLRAALATVTGADAVVAVTPVFSASYSGLFKSFVDLLDPEALSGRPVLVGATGGSARHSLVLDHAMRPLFAYLGASVVPTGVFAATEDFASSSLDARIARAGHELAVALLGPTGPAGFGGGEARHPSREAGYPSRRVDEVGRLDSLDEGSVTPFAQLLGEQR